MWGPSVLRCAGLKRKLSLIFTAVTGSLRLNSASQRKGKSKGRANVLTCSLLSLKNLIKHKKINISSESWPSAQEWMTNGENTPSWKEMPRFTPRFIQLIGSMSHSTVRLWLGSVRNKPSGTSSFIDTRVKENERMKKDEGVDILNRKKKRLQYWRRQRIYPMCGLSIIKNVSGVRLGMWLDYVADLISAWKLLFVTWKQYLYFGVE